MSIRKKLAGKMTKLAMPREERNDHPAATNYENGNYYIIDIELISPDPNQPRKHFDPESLAELSQSIKQKGVLQPIIIRKDGEKIWLVAGERRYRAARMAGLAKIPAMLTTGNPAEIALIENLQREDLKAIEEAEALARVMEEFRYTHDQLAMVVGKARSTITEALSLNKLPVAIKDECRRADNFPRRLLVEISKQKTPNAMMSLFKQVKIRNLKSTELRNITRKKRKNIHGVQAEVAVRKVTGMTTYLSGLKMDSLEQGERLLFLQKLTALKKILDDLLMT
ncbi:MAG: hypothetical protein A2521_06580 [Deltaproteobacteria bacterium RIFOXYD12_FULL_57_12]|nr:MAG: hypothetical protein A2521_06580 [Deltaproteobacteria bacterium RIFOXYD12_FULL_57_12]